MQAFVQQRQRPFKRRAAALGARLPETRINAALGRTAFDARIALAFGGPFRSIQFIFSNFQFDATGNKFDAPTTLTINKAALELNGLFAPILFSGGRSITLASGEVVAISDRVRPAQFALSSFSKGILGYFRGSASVPDNTGWFPTGCIAVNSTGDSFGALYDPANDLDQVDALGPMTLPTDALSVTDFTAVGNDSATNNMGWGPSAVIGETYDRRMVVMMLVGPSTTSGREDDRVPTTMNVGWGFMDLAMLAEDGSLDDVVPMIHATRTGSMLGHIGVNPAVAPFFKYAAGGIGTIWIGNNGIADSDYTPKQEVEENLTGLHASMSAAGISNFILTLGMPRNDSSDNYTTYAGLSPTSGRYDYGGAADYLNRRIAEWAARHRDAVVMPFPGLRSTLDPRKWLTDGVTAQLATTDGLHPGHYGHGLLADGIRWARQTGVGLSPLSKNWAAACVVRPSLTTVALVEQALGQIILSGAQLQQLWWLDAPIDGSEAGKQTRRVSLIWPGVWDLYPVSDPSGITYGTYGTKSNGSQQLGLYNEPASDWSPGANSTPELAVATLDNVAIFAGVNDDADNLPVFGAPTATTAQRTLTVNPKNASGQVAVRLNDTTTSTWASATAVGDWAFIRNGNNRYAYQDKVQKGTDTLAPTQFSNARCRVFGSINVGDTTLKELRYLAIGKATPSQAANVVDALRLLRAP